MFGKLRGKLRELDIDQPYIAEKLGISATAVSRKMNGANQWKLAEMYTLMDLFLEPYDKLNEYFPKNGVHN